MLLLLQSRAPLFYPLQRVLVFFISAFLLDVVVTFSFPFLFHLAVVLLVTGSFGHRFLPCIDLR